MFNLKALSFLARSRTDVIIAYMTNNNLPDPDNMAGLRHMKSNMDNINITMQCDMLSFIYL